MDDTRKKIDAQAAAVEQEAIGWRHRIHQNPELSNREVDTAKLVSDHLKSLGFDDVASEVGGHGVVGLLKGGQPGDKVMGLRADMDALPIKELQDVPFRSTKVDDDYPGGPFPVGHMCGHDVHTAGLMGAATVLAAAKEDLPGTVKLIFQPAEEGPPIEEEGGARLMIEQGAATDPAPDMMFVLHTAPAPDGMVLYTPNHALASSDYLEITVLGAGVHGSTPWMGKDPMPVAAEIITGLSQVYRQVPATDAMTITIGTVEDQGRFNVIGDAVKLIGTIRIIQDGITDDVHARVERIASGIAQAHGLTATTTFKQHVPAVVNDPAWLQRVLPTVRRVVGEHNVVEMPPVMAYDDASEFVNPIGGSYLFVGGQDVLFENGQLKVKAGGRGMAPNHNARFYFNDSGLINFVRLYGHVTYDFLVGDL